MTTPNLLMKYPLDLSGKAPTNLIIAEPHDLESTKRAIVLRGGPFYTKTVVIRDRATGKVLEPVTDYLLLQPYEDAIQLSGLNVCSIVYVPGLEISAIEVDYQVVGGEFSWTVYALKEMIDSLSLDERPVAWGDVLGKPNAYPPTPHLHDLGDTYGWEYIAYQLEGIRTAILVGDIASHEELKQYMDSASDDLKDLIDQLDQRFTSHGANTSNPHNVTKAQVGLGSVENYGISTKPEAEAGVVNNKYMTPLRTAEAIAALAGTKLDAHINDKDNPHAVTKAQVGLGSVQNYPIATLEEAQQGNSSTTYMTPRRTYEAISWQAGAMVGAHAGLTNNPHSVTKAQVGLGLVENYGISTQAEAEAGGSTSKYMTPLTTKQAIDKIAGDALAAHTAIKNPHGTTASDVGAYSKSQSDTLLNGKLGVSETAVNASKLEGRTKAQVISDTVDTLGNFKYRNLYVSGGGPTSGTGVDGDVWFQY